MTSGPAWPPPCGRPTTTSPLTEVALDVAQALADLNIASRDLAEPMHQTRHLPDVLIRSQLLFSPERTLKPTVEGLANRAKGHYVAVDITDRPNLAPSAHQAAVPPRRRTFPRGTRLDVQSLRAEGVTYSSEVNFEL